MDGNGRWANEHGVDRSEGHREGVVSVRKVVEAACAVGLKYLTIYTFSTENWKRPEDEVNALMALMVLAIERETPDLIRNNVKLNAIGESWRLPEDVCAALDDCILRTSSCTGLTLTIALSYSARTEIISAVKQIADDFQRTGLNTEEIDEEMFTSYLMTKDLPEPDLLIRTGGEKRVSNFLLWQISYTELYFTDIYWPDFRQKEFYEALKYYTGRERRFGKTSEQITKS
jgi:undecaprenyl diphosphate synthase